VLPHRPVGEHQVDVSAGLERRERDLTHRLELEHDDGTGGLRAWFDYEPRTDLVTPIRELYARATRPPRP
jgi:hypothetical protein